MQRIWITVAIVLMVSGLGVTRFSAFEERLARLDEFSNRTPQQVIALEAELADMSAALEMLRTELGTIDAEGDANEDELRDRIATLRQELAGAADRIAEQMTTINALEARYEESGPEAIESRLNAFEAGANDRLEGLSQVVTAAVNMAEKTRDELSQIQSEIGDDVSVRWEHLVGPTVQLAGDTTVGSGVLLESQADAESKGFETYLLTSWHVVRDIRADSLEDDPPIPVAIYSMDGSVRSETAQLLHHDVELDAALLRVDTTERIEHGARLAPRERIENAHIFEQVYAVGCPLGNDPIPTRGEIADTEHFVDGEAYWMISAPTYIGNSGGGIYDGVTHELLGIFSKIYTHGSMRPTIVPHMGLVTPLSQIYDWLATVGYDEAKLRPFTGPRLASASDG